MASLIRKAATALDKVAIELAMKDREIMQLRIQLEQAKPRKKCKIRQDLNERFLSLAQVLAQTNCEPEQRVIQSQNSQSDDIIVDGESSSEEAPTRWSICNRQPTKQYLERDLEESD